MNTLRTYSVVVLSALAVVFMGCAQTAPRPAQVPVVTGLAVAQVQQAAIPEAVDAVGTIHARESAILSSQVMGRVTSVAVREGDRIRAGQLLMSLDDAQAASELDRSHATAASGAEGVKEASTDAELAKSTLARYQVLRDRKSVSPQEFDEVQRRSESAAARLESARSMLDASRASEASSRVITGYARLHAPFAGVVTARHVDPGAMATPGIPLLEVDRNGPLQLFVTVDESLLSLLRRGMALHVTTAALSQPMNGRIVEIVPAAQPASHSFLVKIDLPAAAGLRSGMYGTAAVETRNRAALLVPQSAVVTHGSLNSVWILDSDRIAFLRYVTLGAMHDASVEVLSGLSAKETVVLAPGDRDLSGSRVEVHQ